MTGNKKKPSAVSAHKKGVTDLKKKKPRKNFFKGIARYQTTVAGGGPTVAGGGGFVKRDEKQFVRDVQDWIGATIKEEEKIMVYGKEKVDTNDVHPTSDRYGKQDAAQKHYWELEKKRRLDRSI